MEGIERFLIEYAYYYNLKPVIKTLTSFYTTKDLASCSVSHVRFLLVWLEDVVSRRMVDQFDLVINLLSRLYKFVEPVVSLQLYFNMMSKLKVLVILYKLSSNENEALILLDQYFPESNCCIPLPVSLPKHVKFDLVQKTQLLRLYFLPLFHNDDLQQDYMKENFTTDFNDDYFQDLHYSFYNFLSVVKEILRETSFTKIDDAIILRSKAMALAVAVFKVLNMSHESHPRIINYLKQTIVSQMPAFLKNNYANSPCLTQFQRSLQTPASGSLSNSKSHSEEIEFVPDSFPFSDPVALIPNIQQHLLSQVHPCLVKLIDRRNSFQQGGQTYVIYN